MSLFLVYLKQGGEPFNIDLSKSELDAVVRAMTTPGCECVVTDGHRAVVVATEIAALVPLEANQ